MKSRLILLVLACALSMQAQMEMNVDQLAQFIRSELALKQNTDKQLAAYLKGVHLTERLPDKTIEDLEEQGAGPKTVQALKQMQAYASALKPPAKDPTSSPGTTTEATSPTEPTSTLRVKETIPPPDSVREREILDQIRDYALSYTKTLPNFVCVEVTRRYIEPDRGYGADNFHSLGDILAKLSYNQGHENYQVYSVGGKYQEGSMEAVRGGGAISTGEFGSMMREIFEPDSQAEFHWDHWGKLRGRRMAVFHYYIESGHSKFTIEYGDAGTSEQRIFTAYEGLVYADENTGEITRIQFHAVNIPNSFPVKDALEILDYGQVDISGTQFIVPLAARLTMNGAGGKTKNELEFRNYRHFGADVGITFGGEVPPPLGSDQTEEQPINGNDATPKKNSSPKPAETPKQDQNSNPFGVPTLPPPPPPQ